MPTKPLPAHSLNLNCKRDTEAGTGAAGGRQQDEQDVVCRNAVKMYLALISICGKDYVKSPGQSSAKATVTSWFSV